MTPIAEELARLERAEQMIEEIAQRIGHSFGHEHVKGTPADVIQLAERLRAAVRGIVMARAAALEVIDDAVQALDTMDEFSTETRMDVMRRFEMIGSDLGGKPMSGEETTSDLSFSEWETVDRQADELVELTRFFAEHVQGSEEAGDAV